MGEHPRSYHGRTLGASDCQCFFTVAMVTLELCCRARAAAQQEPRLHLESELPAWVVPSLTPYDLIGCLRQDSSTSTGGGLAGSISEPRVSVGSPVLSYLCNFSELRE